MSRPKPSSEYLDLTGQKPRDRSAASKSSTCEAGRPSRPGHLSDDAKKEWRRCVRILQERGTLTKGDGPALEVYCETYARWRMALKHIQEHGLFMKTTRSSPSGKTWDVEVENPASKLAASLENSIRQYQKELSLTPAARDKARRVSTGRNGRDIVPGSVADLRARAAAAASEPDEPEEEETDVTESEEPEETEGEEAEGSDAA